MEKNVLCIELGIYTYSLVLLGFLFDLRVRLFRFRLRVVFLLLSLPPLRNIELK